MGGDISKPIKFNRVTGQFLEENNKKEFVDRTEDFIKHEQGAVERKSGSQEYGQNTVKFIEEQLIVSEYVKNNEKLLTPVIKHIPTVSWQLGDHSDEFSDAEKMEVAVIPIPIDIANNFHVADRFTYNNPIHKNMLQKHKIFVQVGFFNDHSFGKVMVGENILKSMPNISTLDLVFILRRIKE